MHNLYTKKRMQLKINGALGRIRAYNRLIRNQVLYPVELRGHGTRWRDWTADLIRVKDLLYRWANRALTWYSKRDSNPHACALVPKTSVSTIPPLEHGAFGEIRTPDTWFFKPLLYQLSYKGERLPTVCLDTLRPDAVSSHVKKCIANYFRTTSRGSAEEVYTGGG